MLELKGYQRSYLFKNAHSLKPIVMVGKAGLTEGVIEAVKKALEDHELIKVKFVKDKEIREQISGEIAEKLDATLIKTIGNVTVFYKEAEKPEDRNYRIPG